jgi:hypothetical protein
MGLKNVLTIKRISFITLFLAFNHFSVAERDDLKEEFAFENGPRFDMPEEQQKLIDQTIAELKSGHGITTIPKPDNAFVSCGGMATPTTWKSSTTIREGCNEQNKEGLDDSSRRYSQDRIHGANEDNGLSLGKGFGFSGHL